jgi:predicted HTH transcriptional regulator
MDLTGWLEYFTRGLATQLVELKDRGEKVIWADLAVRKFGLNERQSKALKFLAAHERLTIQNFEQMCPEVNRRSLQRDLKGLVENGMLREVGAGSTDPTRHYIWTGYDAL